MLNNEFFGEWFESMKPWNGEAASFSRTVWLNCMGMPLNAWCADTFKSIGANWGKVLTIERNTCAGTSFDRWRVLINTESETIIDSWINLEVNGKIYKVKIWEESFSMEEDKKVKVPVISDSPDDEQS